MSVTTYTRFGCPNNAVELITSHRLEFAQQFGEIPIFMVVSALTTTITATTIKGETKSLITIGEILEYTKIVVRTLQQEADTVESTEEGVHHEDASGTNIPPIIRTLTHRILNTVRSPRLPPGLADIKMNKTNHSQIVENAIMKLTSWLRVRLIILEQKEYLSVVDFIDTDSPTLNATKVEGEENKSFSFWDNEALFKDFISHKPQRSGRISSVCLAWKYSVSLRFIEAFRDWGVKEKKLSSVIRMSTVKDDWGSP